MKRTAKQTYTAAKKYLQQVGRQMIKQTKSNKKDLDAAVKILQEFVIRHRREVAELERENKRLREKLGISSTKVVPLYDFPDLPEGKSVYSLKISELLPERSKLGQGDLMTHTRIQCFFSNHGWLSVAGFMDAFGDFSESPDWNFPRNNYRNFGDACHEMLRITLNFHKVAWKDYLAYKENLAKNK